MIMISVGTTRSGGRAAACEPPVVHSVARGPAAALALLHAKLPRYRAGTFQGWLYRLTRNVFLDLRRRTRLRDTNMSDVLSESSLDPSAADLTLRGNRTRVAGKELGDLPAELGVVICLRDMYGLSYEELVRRLAAPVGAVRSRIHRGRERLRELLRGYAEEP